MPVATIGGLVLAGVAACGGTGTMRTPAATASPTPATGTGHYAARPAALVPHSAAIQGPSEWGHDYNLGHRILKNVGDTSGTGRDSVALGGRRLFVLEQPPAPGTHQLLDVAPGGISAAPDNTNLTGAGDADGDGFGDIWENGQLFRGPFDGGLQKEPYATFDCPGFASHLGGFDADGDGHADVALGGGSHEFVVFYGPFPPGTISWCYAEGPLPPHSLFYGEPNCPDGGPLQLVRDLPAPGDTSMMVGDDIYLGCDRPSELFQLDGPRGRMVSQDASFAWFYLGRYAPVGGDFNADGWVDFEAWDIMSSPPEGGMNEPEDAVRLGATVVISLGDLTGDGLVDLIANQSTKDDIEHTLLIPGFDTPTNPEVFPDAAARAAMEFWDSSAPNPDGWSPYDGRWTTADLDGDGLQDLLIAGETDDHPPGEVRIWYGRDLLALIASGDWPVSPAYLKSRANRTE